MAEVWYYTRMGQQQRPASTEQLRRYAASGLLRPRDLVWKDGMRRWVPAYTISEFGLRPPRGGRADGVVDLDGAGTHSNVWLTIRLGVVVGLALVIAAVMLVMRMRVH